MHGWCVSSPVACVRSEMLPLPVHAQVSLPIQSYPAGDIMGKAAIISPRRVTDSNVDHVRSGDADAAAAASIAAQSLCLAVEPVAPSHKSLLKKNDRLKMDKKPALEEVGDFLLGMVNEGPNSRCTLL